MKRLLLGLVCISILGYRVITGQPEQLTAGTSIRLVIPTIDYPEYSESQTIIRRGQWEVRYPGYIDFIPGDTLQFQGIVDERGKIVATEAAVAATRTLSGVDWGLVQIAKLRHWAVERLQRSLPEPQASLAIGILLGVKRNMPREFYEALIDTGTLHLVAASGYNVAVLAAVVLAGSSMVLPKYWAMSLSGVAIWGYVMLAGASASVVRAGVMGSLTMIGVILGRQHDAKRLLWVAGYLMLMAAPELLGDIGFQLSMAATVGILYIAPRLLRLGNVKYFVDYLYPTVAATVATAPVIWWYFGRLAMSGVWVNLLILPLVPLIMLLSAMTLIISPIAYLLYVPLWWVVAVIRFFG